MSKLSAQTSSLIKPARHPLPEHLPRKVKTYAPKEESCVDCGRLRRLGQDVSEVLEYVPARFKVMRYVRPKLSCAKCERIVQAPAPSRPIERGLVGPGLLARRGLRVSWRYYVSDAPATPQSSHLASHFLLRGSSAGLMGCASVRNRLNKRAAGNTPPRSVLPKSPRCLS